MSDVDHLVWSIPSTILPSTLDGDIKIIDDFLLDPVDPQGKTAADLLRKKRKAPVRRKRRELSPEMDDEGNVIVPEKKKRQKKREEEIIAYKSAQFIEDSDDDAEADALFFAAEAAVSRRCRCIRGSVT